jgi:Tfp pilus assembly protein FimV
MDQYSRFRFCVGLTDEKGRPFLSEAEPYLYRSFADNVQHQVVEGDTLWSLAAKYFDGVSRPEALFWVLAQFQPEPIHDPTLALVPGSVLVIPSLRTLLTEIFSETRRQA